MKQHNGSLVATSEGLGCGCTFSVQLPVYPHAQGTNLLPIPESSEPENKEPPQCEEHLKLLVVDDVLSNRKLLSRLLEKKGHHCDMAENGQECVDMVMDMASKGDEYDAVLCDYEMPVMNGPTAAAEIRNLGSDVFFVGVTGNMLSEDVDYYKSRGANVVLPKPVQISILEEVLVEHGVLCGWCDAA